MMSFYSQSYLASQPREELSQFRRTHLSLGIHPKTRDELFVSTIHRESGTYVLGKQGSGKSSFLKTLILQDAAVGNAVFVLDPHLDLTNELLAELPSARAKDTYLLDMADEEHPFGINLFSVGDLKTSQQREQAIERIMHVFEVLWPGVSGQQYLPNYLTASTVTLLANPGSTLVDMLRLLQEPDYRAQLLRRVTDPLVLDFWRKHDALGKGGETRIAPLTGRLNALFMGRSIMRNIVGQRVNTINWRQAIEEKRIIFIQLPVNAMAQNAYLIGTMIVGQLSAALFSYADTPREQRPGVSIYIDEFQNFTTPDFRKIFTEGRKYGARLVVAHQYRDQLLDYLQDSTLTARTIVCFNVTTDDAPEMGKQFPAQDSGTFEPSTRATKELLAYASDFPPGVREFIEVYLRRLPKGNGDIEFKIQPGLVGAVLFDQTKPIKVKRQNPLSHLDLLFYEVMRTQNPYLPIPEEAVYGLAGGGEGFHGAINRWTNVSILERDIPDFPKHLYGYDHQGTPIWLRKHAEGPKEQLFHCLFHLRLTMHYLAEHPVGKEVVGKSSHVADLLTQLAPRMAFVKSDKTTGVIYTHNTPPPLTGAELDRRMEFIRAHTRAEYCQPRQQVEQAQHPATEQQPITVHTTLEGEIPLRQPSQMTKTEQPTSRWEGG